MKSVFLTFFLASAAYEYEHEVLNIDFTARFNWLRTIFFCNNSFEKRSQNKRAKELKEKERIDKIGKGKNEEDDGDDGGDGADIGSIGAADGQTGQNSKGSSN